LAPATILWDSGRGSVGGFGIRRQKDARVFILKYSLGGRGRWYTIGRFGSPWTVDAARNEAKRILGEVVQGHDPRALRRRELTKGLTVADLCDHYMVAAEAGLILTRFNRPKRPSTLAIDRGRIDRHIKPLIGSSAVRDLTRATIRGLIADIAAGKTRTDLKTRRRGRAIVRGGQGAASRVVDLFSGIMTWAVEQELVDQTPVRGVRRYRSEPRDRYLSDLELGRLGQFLQSPAASDFHPYARAIVETLCLTGCRLGEIANLRWNEIDFQDQCLRLAASKTGKSMRPVGTAGLRPLLRQPRLAGSAYVFPAATGSGAYQGAKRTIPAILAACEIGGATSHTLRHTFATIASRLGYSDATIGGLLGHAARGVTSRYIHRPDLALLAAADRVSAEIAGLMGVRQADAGDDSAESRG
jgi:integrase